MRTYVKYLTTCFVLSSFVWCCTDSEALEHHRVSTGVMGTDLVIEVYGPDKAGLVIAVSNAVKEIERVEDMMTTWRESPLTKLNDRHGQGVQAIPLELAQIIGRSRAIHALTDEAFDVTYYAVGRLWKFKADNILMPSEAEIKNALPLVDASRIVVREDPPGVGFPEGMAIGLGGIAKGYGVDRAMAVLVEHGIKHAVVNAGGDLKVLGTKNGAPWEIAVKHPRDRDRAIAAIRLANQSMVTSGDYERFFEKDGKRYHHIIDPRNGYPAKGCMSATVIGPSAELSDALATACCILGPEAGLKLLNKVSQTEGVLVGMDGIVYRTPGLSDKAPNP